MDVYESFSHLRSFLIKMDLNVGSLEKICFFKMGENDKRVRMVQFKS